MSQLIRQVTLQDLHPYHELIVSAYQADAALGVHFAAEHADEKMIIHHLLSNPAYVLEEDGRLVTTLSLRFPWGNNPGPFGVPHLGWFATHPEFKQQGKGRELFEWVEQHVLTAQLRLPAVSLGTAKNHPWLVAMYKKMGFQEIKEADLGTGHITVYLIKVLNRELFDAWASKHAKELK